MMIGTIITLAFIIVVLFGGTIGMLVKCLGHKEKMESDLNE